MLRMSMGNRLLVPGAVPVQVPVAVPADGCCSAMDTTTAAALDDSASELPEPATLPARNSFEIMNQFNWDMVDTAARVFRCTCS